MADIAGVDYLVFFRIDGMCDMAQAKYFVFKIVDSH